MVLTDDGIVIASFHFGNLNVYVSVEDVEALSERIIGVWRRNDDQVIQKY